MKDVAEKLRYLNSADGPNIPMRTLAIYTGINASDICNIINGKRIPKRETQKKIAKGLRELAYEIWMEVGKE